MKTSFKVSVGLFFVRIVSLVCLLLMILCLPDTARSQYVVNSWTTADGLPVNSVNAVVQGQGGYIWLATYDGLVRFDGVRFTVFNSATHPNLPSNRFISLTGTEDGALWLTSEQNHLIRFHENQFSVFDTEAGLPHNDVTVLLHGADGSLLIGTRRGVARYDLGGIERLAGNEVTGHILSLLHGPGKTLWIGTDHEVLRLESDGTVHRILPADGRPWAPVESLARVGNSVWIGTSDGISVWNDGVVQTLPGPEELTQRSAFDIVEMAGIVWLNTSGGVYGYREGRIVHRPEPDERVNLVIRYLRDPTLMDKSGSLWVNTGRRLIRDGQTVFRSEAQLFSVITDREGNLWVPAENGLHRLRFSPFGTYREEDGLQDTLTGRFGKISEKVARQQHAMLRNTRQLQQLIEQVLNLNRLESGHLEVASTPGDLVRFIRRIVETNAPLAERNGIDLTLDCEAEHCPRLFDKEKLEKIVGNLLSNALKFTPRDGKVQVSLRCGNATELAEGRDTGQSVEISVADNGPGIPAGPDTECIPVVMLTARAAEDDQVEGYGSGAEAYITKPFSPETLRAAIARLLEERQRLRRRLQEGAKRALEKEQTPRDANLRSRARNAVLNYLYDERFGVGELASALNMSRPTLYRRLNEEAGLSPGELIWTVCVEHAHELLTNGAGSVSEVAYAIGFKSLSHFTHSFREHFGKVPSSVLGN